jgi:heme oxygenase
VPDQSLRFLLRTRTAAVHAELDAMVGDWPDLEAYKRYARAVLAFRAPLEHAFAALQLSGPFTAWQSLTIAPELRADLADLRVADPEPLSAPYASDVSWIAGALYVLEGSSVGARILVRRAAELGLSSTHGARHLAAQTADRQRWPSFLALLDSPSLDPETAVAGAEDTFALALEAFQREITCSCGVSPCAPFPSRLPSAKPPT